MSEIENCRCGAPANATTNGYYWYVECSRCPAAVDGACRTEQEAIAAWRQRLRKGHWKCTHCPNIETSEREVYCWKCGEGQMIYVKPAPPKLRLVEGGRPQ